MCPAGPKEQVQMRRQVIAASVVAAAVIPLSPGVAGAAPATPKVPTASSEAKALVKTTKALNRSIAKRGQLIVLADRIKRQQASQPCSAIGTIKIYRRTLKKLPKSSRKRSLAV